jgi:hypothetical protein
VKQRSKPARRQSSVEPPTPAPDAKRAPVAAEATANDMRLAEQNRERVRRCRLRKGTGDLVMKEVPGSREFFCTWLGLDADDATDAEIHRAWSRFWAVSKGETDE